MKFEDTHLYQVLLEYINLDLLNEVFRTTMEKYGVEEVPTIDPTTFELFEWKAPLSYLVDTDQIYVNPNVLINVLEGLSDPVAATVLAHILIHEQTHRISHGELRTNTINEAGKTVTSTDRTSGYSRSQIKETDEESHGQMWFELFNEGVTETIAQAIFDKYATAFGVPAEPLAEIHRVTGRDPNSEHNNRFTVELADTVAETLALDAGVSKEEMWKAIVMGALRGDRLDDPEIKEWLNAAMSSDDFVDRLRDIELYQFDVFEMLDEMKKVQKETQKRKPFTIK